LILNSLVKHHRSSLLLTLLYKSSYLGLQYYYNYNYNCMPMLLDRCRQKRRSLSQSRLSLLGISLSITSTGFAPFSEGQFARTRKGSFSCRSVYPAPESGTKPDRQAKLRFVVESDNLICNSKKRRNCLAPFVVPFAAVIDRLLLT